jgi:hypothetical protein
MIEDTHEYFCVRTPVHESGRRKAKKWQKHRNDIVIVIQCLINMKATMI